jgi:hypothetical protein
MIRISNTVVFGFEPALHGMRNPKESWKKSDSDCYYTPPRRTKRRRYGRKGGTRFARNDAPSLRRIILRSVVLPNLTT